MDEASLVSLLHDAIAARRPLQDPAHESGLRLFNGFSEGCPGLAIDLYGATIVLQNHADPPAKVEALIAAAGRVLQDSLPWLRAGLVKTRNSGSQAERRGVLAFGDHLTTQIREGRWLYALDLTLHQDCSLYLDTRNVRLWASEYLAGKTVLNAFAYTGSLGVAALGGGAQRVIQLDRTRRYFELARASYALNHLAVRARDFVRADFFRETGRLRHLSTTFECVFLDPPFFSTTAAGVVDLEAGCARLINKVRPLVAAGGKLVAINNALYLSGSAYMRVLESLCADGHLQILELLPVPDDIVGMLPPRPNAFVTDPAPFNHPTKIAVLQVL